MRLLLVSMRLLLVSLLVGGGGTIPYNSWFSTSNSRDTLDSLADEITQGWGRMSKQAENGWSRMSKEAENGWSRMSKEAENGWSRMSKEAENGLENINSRLDGVGRMVQDDIYSLQQHMLDWKVDMEDIIPDSVRSIGDWRVPELTNIRQMVGDNLPSMDLDIFKGFGTNFNPFGIRGNPKRPWWEGDNVCVDRQVSVDRQVLDGHTMDGVQIEASPNLHMQMQVHKCEESEGVYRCEQFLLVDGQRKTVKSTFSCCHGYKQNEDGACQEFDIRPTEETIADLEGSEFLALFSEENLLGSLSNSTVFLPTNEAILAFKSEMAALMTGGDKNGNVVYSIDDGLINDRKKRGVDVRVSEEMAIKIAEEVAIKNILHGHLSPQILSVKDFSNNGLVQSKAEESSPIRMSVYNTYPKKVVLANCALIISKDHHTTTGVIHVVDKVIQPASQTIGSILLEDVQFRTFTSALGTSDMEQLDSENSTLTVFAPTEKAFQTLTELEREKVLGSGSCGSHILRGHILPSIVCSGAVQGRVQVWNELGERVLLHRDEEGRVYVDNKQLVMKDIVATNGVIHVIDAVIIPESVLTLEEELRRRRADQFLDFIERSNLKTRLNELDAFTVFLPTQQAINQIGSSMLDIMKRDPELLEQIVLHHVIQTKPNRTVEDKALSGRVHHGRSNKMVSCARILGSETRVCGGRIQLVDRLLLPSSTSLMDTLKASPEHSQFFKLLQDTSISEEITGPHTIFAPTNQALEELEVSLQHKIFGDRVLLKKLLKNHIIPDIVCCASVPQYNIFSSMVRGEKSVAGQTLFLRRSPRGHVGVNQATLHSCDTVAEDGVLHSIDKVLLPTQLQGSRVNSMILNYL